MKGKTIRICAGLFLTLCMTAIFAPQAVEAAPKIVDNYLEDTDVVVISPAENRDSRYGRRIFLGYNNAGWTLTIQNNNSQNGDDLQMWQFGVSGKLKVDSYNKGDGTKDGGHFFRLRAINWRESSSPRFVDVKGKKKGDGTNIHVWKESGGNEAKWFGLVEDGDRHPDTFYIYNRHSQKYLAPENYFDSKNTSFDHRQCLHQGKNTVLSSNAFRWRIEVINRTPKSMKSQRAWMSKMTDATPIADLNIPGTHDAATANVEGSWQEGYNVVACQKYFIQEQLQVGVRALDLRLRKKGDKLLLVHGSSTWAVCHTPDNTNDVSDLTMDMVMEDIQSFLSTNDTEFVIATIKVDGGSQEDAADAFKDVANDYKDMLYTWENDNPTVGDVRGKLVLFSRIGSLKGGIYGPDLSQWDNKYDADKNKVAQIITGDNATPAVYVQDAYNGNGDNKKKYFKETLKDLADNPQNYKYSSNKPAFVFNYTSSQIFLINTPLNVARTMNNYLLTSSDLNHYFNRGTKMGIVVMDYIDEPLCQKIIDSNYQHTTTYLARIERMKAASPKIVDNYLKDTDVVVISPAENRDSKNGNRVSLGYNTAGWTLTIQNNNSRIGDDLQMWQFGVSGKLKVDSYNKGYGAEDGGHFFRLHAINWRESSSSRFVDVKNNKTSDGTNIHVRKSSGGDVAKWFGLVEDDDGDPDTFYIFNRHSQKYLAPENYFDKGKTSFKHRQCLHQGKNIVLSSNAFRWRIEVINRTPDSMKSQRAWMSKLPNAAPIADLNIPGTHDAATANVKGSWKEGYNVAACQKYFIQEQLQVGVRALDLRLRKKGDKLLLVNDSSICAVCRTPDNTKDVSDLTMKMVMKEIQSFLSTNKTEFVIATIKVNGGNEKDAADAFEKVANDYKDMLYTWNKDNPTVGDVRGKLVLFSRIGSLTGGIYGPDLSQWDKKYDAGKNKVAQKITDDKTTPAVYVQDANNGNGNIKMKYVKGTLKDLADNPQKYKYSSNKPAFVFNYTSSQIFNVNSSLNVARTMNNYLLTSSDLNDYFNKGTKMGIVVMDYIDEPLCRKIIDSNSQFTTGHRARKGGVSGMSFSTRRAGAQTGVMQTMALRAGTMGQADNAMLLSKSDAPTKVTGDGYTMEILWPELTPIVYGHTLNEVGLRGGAAVLTEEGSSPKPVYGTFRFRDSSIVPNVSDSGVTKYVLEFVPTDSGYQTASKEVKVTVKRCPLDLFIGNYEQQYGDEAANWRDIVNVTGRIAEQDEEKLRNTSMTLTKDGKEHLLEYTGSTTVADVLPAGLPVGSKGDIKIAYKGKETRKDFPNYDLHVSDKGTGTWEIVPRELSIEWKGVRHYLNNEKLGISADIGNIYNNEDVSVKVKTGLSPKKDDKNGFTTYQAELSLTGKDAGNYTIPETMQTVSYTVGATPKKVHNPQIRLAEGEYTYTGKEVCPTVTLYDDGIAIPESEYSVSYKDNVECGMATVTITSLEGGSYDITMDNFSEDGVSTSDSTSLQYEITKTGAATEEAPAPETKPQAEAGKTDKEQQRNYTPLLIILACAVLLCAAGFIFIKKRRAGKK